jgi:hypothetical protein
MNTILAIQILSLVGVAIGALIAGIGRREPHMPLPEITDLTDATSEEIWP